MKKDNKNIMDKSFKDEVVELINEFKKESDRATVIIGAAKLDALLYLLLSQYLLPSTTGRDELLDGDNPLGTFSVKINLSYRLGLINSHFCKSLHLIRKIRNSFAHEVKGCSLKEGGHSDRVNQLSLPFKKYEDYAYWLKIFFEKKEDPATDFRLVLSICIFRIGTAINYAENITKDGVDLIPPGWIISKDSN